MDWRRMLAHVTGTVDQELLLRNEYLLAENRILRGQVRGTPRLDDSDRRTLAELGKRLGRQALEEVASIVRPATILGIRSTIPSRPAANLASLRRTRRVDSAEVS